jgi:hypothetical protein
MGATRRAAAVLESLSSIPRVILIALLAWSGANAPAQARAPYDGLWSVSLKVGQGSCGEHEIEVFIRNGEISHAGQWGFFTAEGRVGERGRIEVNIGALGMTASADGQLFEQQGSGTWQFPERGCSGHWVAERRSA